MSYDQSDIAPLRRTTIFSIAIGSFSTTVEIVWSEINLSSI